MNAPRIPVERTGYQLVSALSGIVASTSRSAALDRAIVSMEATTGALCKRVFIERSKTGAEIILNDWRRIGKALNGPNASPLSRRQARIALKYRAIYGTLVTPPVARSEALRRAATNPLTGGL